MYYDYEQQAYPCFMNIPVCDFNSAYAYMYPYNVNPMFNEYIPCNNMMYDYRCNFYNSPNKTNMIDLKDYGPNPFAVNIEDATLQNNNFRTALWTGKHLQLTLMNIDVGGDIGLEMHSDLDQFIRIEQGNGIVKMGPSEDNLNFTRKVSDDFAFIIPAGTWHNLINTGNEPIKLYSIYAPPQHAKGTVHKTKADAEASEEEMHK